MRLRLTPQKTSFYDLFANSAKQLVMGSAILSELVHTEKDKRAPIAEQMRQAEHDCDETTHAIMREVNSTFVTPFDREDIYRLASSLDDVMDHMDAAADLIFLYGMSELPRRVTEQVEVLQQMAEVTADAIPRLRGMNHLEDYWIEINRLENAADKEYRKLLAKLFSGEFDALTVLKLKDIVDQLELAADAFEKVAHTIESIAVKES